MAHAHPPRKTYLVNPQLQISLTVRMLGVAAMAFAITVLNLTAFCYLSSACSALPSTSAVRGAFATLAEGYGLLYLLLMVIFSFGALVIVCLLIAVRDIKQSSLMQIRRDNVQSDRFLRACKACWN